MNQPRDMGANGRVAAVLRDIAAAETSQAKKWAYRRAADAVLDLGAPIESYVRADGTLRKIANVGPSCAQIILATLRTGATPMATTTATRAQTAMAGTALTPHATSVPADPNAATAGAGFLTAAQIAGALTDESLDGPTLDDYRGDFQMHTTWSDGTASVADMARACKARGYECCAITDHSYGLPIAGGVSMADLARQHREIDAVNRRYRGRFRVFKGIEANILADGRLDMTADEIAQVDLVVASPHSGLRAATDQTVRMVRAVSTPGVHILGHPRGRKAGARAGIKANWARVFARAAKTGVAIELDGDPRRQDIDYLLAAQALAAGCFFALDSDAHSPDELMFADVAVAHARLAGLPLSRIVNCWPQDRLLEWMHLRSTASGP